MTKTPLISTALICAVVALIAFPAGLWLGGHPDSLPGPVRDAFVSDDRDGRSVRAEIAETIERKFYKKVDAETLENRSLKSFVRALGDPFSHYLNPREAKRFRDSVAGRFDGVGMSVEEDRRGLRVLSVFPGSPARAAGIRAGDLILTVGGRSIAGVDSRVAAARIQGPPGTSVRLEVREGGSKSTRKVITVERKRIAVPVVSGRVVDRNGRKLGVVKLLSFSSGAHGLLRRQIDKLLERGADGLVLDLRGNGGGLLSEAVLVSSIFIEDGKIVSVRGRSHPERVEEAKGRAIAGDIPVVVLVDGGSASASEIVAGALRDRKRATLVGTNTFGKGLVQEAQRLSNGGELDLTVANYYLPSGRTIATRKGIKPDLRARDKPSTRRDEALSVALEALEPRRR